MQPHNFSRESWVSPFNPPSATLKRSQNWAVVAVVGEKPCAWISGGVPGFLKTDMDVPEMHFNRTRSQVKGGELMKPFTWCPRSIKMHPWGIHVKSYLLTIFIGTLCSLLNPGLLDSRRSPKKPQREPPGTAPKPKKPPPNASQHLLIGVCCGEKIYHDDFFRIRTLIGSSSVYHSSSVSSVGSNNANSKQQVPNLSPFSLF